MCFILYIRSFWSCAAVVALSLALPLHTTAQGNWRIGGGNSFPIERLTNIANPDKFTTLDGSLLHLSAQAQEIGWNGILRYSANLADNLEWTFFSGLHHFTNMNVLIMEPNQTTSPVQWATVSQSMIPLGTGIEHRVLHLWFIHGYIAADAAYHLFLPRSLQATSLGLQTEGTWFGRGGASLGVGLDVMFWTFGVDISARYHLVNILGRADNETLRSFISLNVSLVFGEKR